MSISPRMLTITLNAAIDKRYVLAGLRVPGVNRVTQCTYSAGGKGINVARVGHIAGAQAMASGFVGGHAGAFITEQLANDGIGHSFVQLKGESRACINILDSTTGQVTELLEPGCAVGPDDVAKLREHVAALLAQADVLTLSGSVPPGCPPGIYADLIALAKDRDVPVVLDTSDQSLTAGIAAKPTLIKPNADEVAALIGDEPVTHANLIDLGHKLNRRGIPYVVFSRGPEGALLVSKDGAIAARPPRVAVANTVGCGDAMVAALAMELAQHAEPEQMLRRAVAISSAAAMSPGTGSFRPLDAQMTWGATVVEPAVV